MHFNGPQTKFIRDSLYKHPVVLLIFTFLNFSKTKLISLSRSDRECEEKVDFNWGDCLDEEFYLKKGE